MSQARSETGLIARFARHRVAPHLLMALMILAGAFSLRQVNTQFFPNFEPGRITVTVVWQGASAEDMEEAITQPLERELRNLDHLDSITSTSAQGTSRISMEFFQGTDMGEALEEAKSRVDQVRSLPEESEEPEVTRVTRFDPIAKVLIYAPRGETAPEGLEGLRQLAQDMRDELLARGISKVDINGLPEQKIAIQVSPGRLRELGLSLPEISDRVAAANPELPAGEVGEAVAGRQLRSRPQRRRPIAFEDIVVEGGPETGRVVLRDIADIERMDREGEVRLTFRTRPAVELDLQRSPTADTLTSARILKGWVADARSRLPPGIEIRTYDETWGLLQERIWLLVENGLWGLVLVLATLFLFLRGRIAAWVALGIPVALLAALAILYGFGGSVNMVSLFAFIMVLGIIVDDAIVVGEEAAHRYQTGDEEAADAAVNAARRMWPPVLSSSLTTIAAFLPLMLVGGAIGKILFDIPFVVICVIGASLLEAFLVLPGHLAHALSGMPRNGHPGGFRQRFDRGFHALREGPYRRLVSWAVRAPGTTLALGVAVLLATAGLLAGGRLPFSFFPAPEGNILHANVKFAASAPRAQMEEYLDHLRRTLADAEEALPGEPVRLAVARPGTTSGEQQVGGEESGDQFGSLVVELVNPEQRQVEPGDVLDAWRRRVQPPPGLESLTLTARSGGPPGRDISVRLFGAEPQRLKSAAQELVDVVEDYPGVSAVEDDMPFGREQVVFRLNAQGQSLGLSQEAVGNQLRAAYAGELTQIFTRGEDEIEVRTGFPEGVRNDPGSLAWVPIETPGGEMVALESVAELSTRQGYEALRHAEARLAIHVQGEVDRDVTNANRVLDGLRAGELPQIAQEYGVGFEYVGRAEDQAETLTDMRRGLVVGAILIYLVLAAVFSSYVWPLIVMGAIPFGLVGGLLGHWLLGMELTVLSLFGLFGLSGIVVNNSIILVSFYRDLRETGMAVRPALVEASCRRLRPMLLTTLTTIAGLTPLLFEDSLQAQFLIPMAVAIVFGLAFATVLVLVLVPALLALQQGRADDRRNAEGTA